MSRQSFPGPKPRLVRQHAVHDDCDSVPNSPPNKLSVRILPTIPSAADSSLQLDEETTEAAEAEAADESTSAQLYTVLQTGGQVQSTLSSQHDSCKEP